MKILVLENVIRCTNLFGEYGKHAVSKEVLAQGSVSHYGC